VWRQQRRERKLDGILLEETRGYQRDLERRLPSILCRQSLLADASGPIAIV